MRRASQRAEIIRFGRLGTEMPAGRAGSQLSDRDKDPLCGMGPMGTAIQWPYFILGVLAAGTGYFLIPVQWNRNYGWRRYLWPLADQRWFVFVLDGHTRTAVAIRFICSLILLGGAIVCFFLSFGRCLKC
jgi:hypothetical protein